MSSSQQKLSAPIRVGIAGAGPAGLCVAGILAREAPGRFEIEIFERDSRERDQGSGWDLDKVARKTLMRAGLDPVLISRPGRNYLRYFKSDSDKPYLVVGVPSPFNRCKKSDPETNRHAMREGLLFAIDSRATVSFQNGVTDVRANGKGGATCFGADGGVLGEYDVVIDASGVGSPLRKIRVPGTDVKDWYTGITCLGGIIQDPETELHPEIVRKLGQGTLMVMGERHDGNAAMSLFFQRFGAEESDHRSQFGLIITREGMTDLCTELGVTPSGRPISEADEKETVERIKLWMKTQMGDRWDPMYVQSIDCVTQINIRPLFMFDPKVLPTTDSSLPFICIGDSLHALPPFTGAGGNLALMDAGELASFLVKYALDQAKQDLISGLRAIELKCFQRAAKIVTGRGERTQKAVVRNYNTRNICQTMSLATLIKGEKWTILKRVAYVIASLYMCIHSLSDYGMDKKKKPL